MSRLVFPAVLLPCILVSTALPAAEPPCPEDAPAACWAEAGRRWVEAGQGREAVELLKRGVALHPDDPALVQLLAAAYQLEDNAPWAQRSLRKFLQRHEDCGVRLWLAWLQLSGGDLDGAGESLQAAVACPPEQAVGVRRRLLEAMLAENRGESTAILAALAVLRDTATIFPEDAQVLAGLVRRHDPAARPPLSGRLDLGLGWTSNALAGSPADSQTAGSGASSPMGQAALALRFRAPMRTWWRPVAELEARSQGFTEGPGVDLSYLLFSVRPGLSLDLGSAELQAAYRFEGLVLSGGDRYSDGPRVFFEGHRAEVDLDLPGGWTLFAGAGRRLFREMGRSRTELDGGFGGGFALTDSLRLLAAASVRWYGAQRAAYDLAGATALLSAEQALGLGFAARVGVMATADWYFDSAGYFDPADLQRERRDWLVKLSLSAFAPPLKGVKFGLTYEYSNRLSTAGPYDYQDHRILAKAIWTFSLDPWGPDEVAPAGHVTLPWNVALEEQQERIQDLLRQDEAAQRGSSCVE